MFNFLFKKTISPIEKCFYALGTINTITIYQNNGKDALEEAMQRVYEIDNSMSIYNIDSDVYKINKNAGNIPVPISDATFKLISDSIIYCKQSNNAMNITMLPILELWRYYGDLNSIPDKEIISSALALVDINSIILDKVNKTVFLQNPEQAIDLGSIAKGYAADLVRETLKEHGIKDAIINLGGNIIVMGNSPKSKDFNVGIQDPLGKRGEYIGTVALFNKAIVTSGSYERYITINNQKYSHIIDPNTGFPADSGVLSATIIADNSTSADALSTAAFVLGLDKAIPYLQQYKGVEAVIITNDRKVYLTNGLKKDFILTNSSFSRWEQ